MISLSNILEIKSIAKPTLKAAVWRDGSGIYTTDNADSTINGYRISNHVTNDEYSIYLESSWDLNIFKKALDNMRIPYKVEYSHFTTLSKWKLLIPTKFVTIRDTSKKIDEIKNVSKVIIKAEMDPVWKLLITRGNADFSLNGYFLIHYDWAKTYGIVFFSVEEAEKYSEKLKKLHIPAKNIVVSKDIDPAYAAKIEIPEEYVEVEGKLKEIKIIPQGKLEIIAEPTKEYPNHYRTLNGYGGNLNNEVFVIPLYTDIIGDKQVKFLEDILSKKGIPYKITINGSWTYIGIPEKNIQKVKFVNEIKVVTPQKIHVQYFDDDDILETKLYRIKDRNIYINNVEGYFTKDYFVIDLWGEPVALNMVKSALMENYKIPSEIANNKIRISRKYVEIIQKKVDEIKNLPKQYLRILYNKEDMSYTIKDKDEFLNGVTGHFNGRDNWVFNYQDFYLKKIANVLEKKYIPFEWNKKKGFIIIPGRYTQIINNIDTK